MRERGHCTLVARSLPGRRGGGPAGQVLATGQFAASHRTERGTDHRRAAPQAVPAVPYCIVHRRLQGNRQPNVAPRGAVQAQRYRICRAGAALRTSDAGRVAAHRHQEAGPLRQGRAPHHRRPHPACTQPRLGARLRGHRRPQPHRLLGSTPTRRRRARWPSCKKPRGTSRGCACRCSGSSRTNGPAFPLGRLW